MLGATDASSLLDHRFLENFLTHVNNSNTHLETGANAEAEATIAARTAIDFIIFHLNEQNKSSGIVQRCYFDGGVKVQQADART